MNADERGFGSSTINRDSEHDRLLLVRVVVVYALRARFQTVTRRRCREAHLIAAPPLTRCHNLRVLRVHPRKATIAQASRPASAVLSLMAQARCKRRNTTPATAPSLKDRL